MVMPLMKGSIGDEQHAALMLQKPARARVAKDVLSGLIYLHQQGFIHRDLKLENVLVSHNNYFIIHVVFML